MKKGEIALVTISPPYGFGAAETKRDLAVVPSNSTLIYELELVSFTRVRFEMLSFTMVRIDQNGFFFLAFCLIIRLNV
jgi:hypothetical protein